MHSKRPEGPTLVRKNVAGAVFVVGIVGMLCAGACVSPPAPGEFGKFRVGGKVQGEAPLPMLPPTTDRAGNVYVLYGGVHLPETGVFIGKVGGGWISGCTLSKGDRWGVHGWVGFTEEEQWYWSGDALVSVSGRTGNCERVLDRDPGTDANLSFRAVFPWVRDTPTRTTLVALVQSPIDPAPFSVMVDLKSEIPTNINPFQPTNATDVAVIGVGADREAGEGYLLVQYKIGDQVKVEARFFDADANQTGRSTIATAGLPEYGVAGYLQTDGNGLVAGLVPPSTPAGGAPATPDPAQLVVFDRSGGRVKAINGMEAIGVHRWENALWVVGTADGHPVIAPIDGGGNLGGPRVWGASEAAASALRGSVTLLDDREIPAQTTSWASPKSAIGPFPFLSDHSLTRHATDTTLWLIAGPSYETGSTKITSFAMAPVGVSYP